MHLSKIAIAVAVVLSLTACGDKNGLSASNSHDMGQKVAVSSNVSDGHTVSDSKNVSISSTAPISTMFGVVHPSIVKELGIDQVKYTKAVKYDGASLLYPMTDKLKELGLDKPEGTVTDKQKAMADAMLAKLAATKSETPEGQDFREYLISAYGALSKGDYAAAREHFTDIYLDGSVVAAEMAWVASQKSPGIRGDTSDSFSKERMLPKGPLDKLADGIASLRNTIDLERPWVDKLESAKLLDLNDARHAIVAHIRETPRDVKLAAMQRVKAPDYFVSNGEAGSPLELYFPSTGEYIKQDEKGLQITRNGNVYYGDGILFNGKAEIALQKSSGASYEHKVDTGSNSSGDVGASNKYSAELKPN
ncbi:hypothetical protein [Quatrionicoccus australiensis]|uniref:hypothetical protein n=1 Tax=Quatrionicoccus australiensis TaxID=138118 RepID=UPI001CFB5943|nr:hypothetical protein [Quatrionicoccus australiensis]MCB4359590.1 hypothetical protein [Quatrionicoccus australiensis]